MKKTSRRRIDVNVEELDRVIDETEKGPLSEADRQKLRTALHAMIERLRPQAKTEKTSSVFGDSGSAATEEDADEEQAAGHGRNGADAYRAAEKVRLTHARLTHGDRCPDCARGNVYTQKEPKALVRILGQAPLAATVYELERLRCNACGQVFTAEEPEGVGPEKYDETASAMIAQLKYGSGVPFHRLERMQEMLGIPLPAGTGENVATNDNSTKLESGAYVVRGFQFGVVSRPEKGFKRITRRGCKGFAPRQDHKG